MIVAVISQHSSDIINLLFSAMKEKFVKFNFSDAKSCFSSILGDLRISSKKRYDPFIKIVTTIIESDKIILVEDCDTNEKITILRKLSAKIIHVGNTLWYKESDLYIEKTPRSVKEVTDFINLFNEFLAKKHESLFEGKDWLTL